MKGGLIINYNDVAAMLAHEDDVVQYEFIRTFLNELLHTCETHYNAEKQLFSVNTRMTKDEKELIGMLGYDGDSQ